MGTLICGESFSSSMREIAFESAVESLAIVVEVVAMTVLTIVGLLAETTGVARLGAGIDPLTVWYVFVGGLALYTGVYMLGYHRVLPRISQLGPAQ